MLINQISWGGEHGLPPKPTPQYKTLQDKDTKIWVVKPKGI